MSRLPFARAARSPIADKIRILMTNSGIRLTFAVSQPDCNRIPSANPFGCPLFPFSAPARRCFAYRYRSDTPSIRRARVRNATCLTLIAARAIASGIQKKKAAVAAEVAEGIASGSLRTSRASARALCHGERERERERGGGEEDSSRRGKSGKNRGEPSITAPPPRALSPAVFLQRQADISESRELPANN